MRPTVSVVTINYNMAAALEGTILSVLAQTYPLLDYVVIDGGSNDGSQTVIGRHAARLAHWTSARDGGVYDAMNKGVAAATGEWVIFMNAGDFFNDPDVVADVFAAGHQDADIIFGDVVRRRPDGSKRLVQARPDALPLQMPANHQCIFTRRSLLLAHPFSRDFSISADHEFLLWAQGSGARFAAVPRVVAIFTRGGISDRHRREALVQLREMLKRHSLFTPGVALRYWLYALRALAGPAARRLLPVPITNWLLVLKRFD